jgi:hypothetical protein
MGDNDGQMVSSRSTPVSVSRESPAVSRTLEGESPEMGASSSSATKDEIPRSESSNDKTSENGAFLFSAKPRSLGLYLGASRNRRH